MPTRLTKAYSDDSGSSGKPSQLPRKHGSLIVPHSQTVCKGKGLSHHKKKRICTSLNLASDIPSYIRGRKDSEPLGLIGHNALAPRKRSRSSMLVLGTAGSDLQAQSDEVGPGKAMVVSTRFGNSNYEKYSAILFHERNAFSALLSRDVGSLPLFSQTETRSFFITKGTTVSKPTHHEGVKIQPLWSSTDSEVDTQTQEDDISCEPSTAETGKKKNVVALSYKINDSFGELSPSLVKVSQHVTLDTAYVNPKEEKARGKLANTRSIESVEASNSRTQSLEAEHLLPCTEASSRWVKRLKPEVGESSSRSRKDAVLQSCWIQRWCQDHSRKGAVVKCEPHSSNDADKKQFPSIAAMALMGKSMTGFRPCKLTKRGPLVIWNTDDHT